MNVNYVDKEEITTEILNIQLREKVRKVIRSIEELESNGGCKNELENLYQEKENLISQGADPDYSRQKFGEIVLLINENLLKKPCFRNYSENWTEDFKSNAIYKIFKYINNFDPNKISKVTGKKISSFAYLTQITYMAFVEVINKRKKDNTDLMDKVIPLNELKPEHFSYSKFIRESTYNNDVEDDMTYINITKIDTSLFLELKKLREDLDSVHVTYPKDYNLSIDEYDKIKTLNFKTLNIIKQKNNDILIPDENSDEDCFVFSDEDFEEWGEWIEKDDND